jgi:hypothetical protein
VEIKRNKLINKQDYSLPPKQKKYIARLVSVHYMPVQSTSTSLVRKEMQKMMDDIYEKFPSNHKREYFVADVYEEE